MPETAANPSRVTALLSNELLGRVEKMRINSRRRFTNRSRGEHLHGKGGSSNEFADYRPYVEGDDIRHVDWNIFSRLQKPYLKLYRHEEEMHVVLLVDASTSMRFAGKLERAKQLAAVFGVMGLFNVERVSAYAFTGSQGPMPSLRPCAGRASMRKLFRFLEGVEAGGDAPLDQGITGLLKHHRGRGVAVVLSDFLTFSDLRPPLNMLFSKGLEIFGVQILSPAEISPDVSSDFKLVDSEVAATLDISTASGLAGIYQEYRLRYERHLEQLCQQRSGQFMVVSSQEPVEGVVLERFKRRGWVV